MSQIDYYETLEIERNASDKEIKEAYRRLAFQYHPDRNSGDSEALDRMKQINEAYAVLSDSAKRQRYDSLRQSYGNSAYDRFREGYSENDIFRDSDINQIFEEFSRAFGFRGFEDVFRDAYGSGFKTFQFHNSGLFGRGFIYTGGRANQANQDVFQPQAKQGLTSRLMSRLAGYALKKMIGVGADQDRDKYDSLTLTPAQARNGGKIPYTDKGNSRTVVITIPPGVTAGQTIRLRGLGSQNGPFFPSGDLYLKVQIKKPLFQKIKAFLKKKAGTLLPQN
ncbi:MAG: DnaJ domain-containing protein [Syntrophorhabdaceae bacterium]